MACPGDDTITLMVCGQLDATRTIALEAHLDRCASCRKVVGVLRSRGESALRENAIGLLSPGTFAGAIASSICSAPAAWASSMPRTTPSSIDASL